MSSSSAAHTLPLWPLPLLCALIPLFAAHLAWWLSWRDGFVPDGIPYFDGSFSISRAARHGWGNDLFKLVMLPCAALQGMCWLAFRQWLAQQGCKRAVALPWLGLIAASFLALYVIFLGSEGETYQLLRRYGVTMYFASTYLGLLLALRALRQDTRTRLRPALMVVALGMLALGLASVGVSGLVEDHTLKDRWENVLEWHLGLWLTAMFMVIAWAWRKARVQLLP